MAAFPYQQPTFLLDSVFLHNNPIKVSDLLPEQHTTASCFSSYPSSQTVHQGITPIDVSVHESSCLESSINVLNSDNEPSVTQKHKPADSSSMAPELDTMENRKNRGGSCLSSAKSEAVKEPKPKKQKKCRNGVKETEEKKSKCYKKNQKQVPEEPPSGYIHVRARRGQATDSHSLAERVRREKISERMRLLQGLVPGCDKVTGKALVLDEIINYVQSLQYQVEFLSMKLASANPILYNFATDLDAFLERSEKPSNLASPLPSMQQGTAFADTTQALTTRSNINLFSQDSLVSFPLQGQTCIGFSQDNGNLLWDVEDQRQRSINECGFNNSCSFQ